MRYRLRPNTILLAALLFAVALAALTPSHAKGEPTCPSSWPPTATDGAVADYGYGVIEYEDFFTDSDGQRWFVIRSSDSNGYSTVRAYPTTDDGDEYIPGSPDETCYLLVRRPGAADDADEPQQLEFTKEFEPPTGIEGDRYALTMLYRTTDGDNWINNDNWLTDAPMGQWYGVTTGADGRVTELSLKANGLAGGITPHLSLLTHLEELELYENELVGWIPPQLGYLTRLELLDLAANQLTGPYRRNWATWSI